jgi:acyl dehydratase
VGLVRLRLGTIDLADPSCLAGRELGPTEWLLVRQDRIDGFADAVEDRHWVHNDPDLALRGPFGTPIAHAHLTLSLLPWFARRLLVVGDGEGSLFYGYDRVRFPAPVAEGSRIRARGRVLEARATGGALETTIACTVEIDGHERPACLAEAIWRHYPLRRPA